MKKTQISLWFIAALISIPLWAHGKVGSVVKDGSSEGLIIFPDVEGRLTLISDLHTHSVFSDGHVWPNIRVSEAQRNGLDILAITEHLEYQPHISQIPHVDRNTAYEEAKKAAGGIDMNDFKDMVENFSPEKMGLNESGSKNTEFSKLVNMLQEKLIHPGKVGRVHNLFLLSKSGIVIANLSAKNVEQTDVDILGGMFTAVKDFMEDAVSASTTSSLNDIQFGNFHVKFASGAYSELAVVYTGIMNQESEDSITDTLMAFEIENSAILENWDGDLSKLEGSTKYLENLFGDIDKDKD